MRSITKVNSAWISLGFNYRDDKKYGLLSWIGYIHSELPYQAYYITTYNTIGLFTNLTDTQYTV